MAGPLEDLVKSLDLQPADIATLFAGLRSSVPVYAAMGATGLNEGEDERLRQIYGPLPPTPVPRETPEMQQRRMIEDFEQRFPTPELRAAVLEQMRANRRVGRYDPATATRRIDFAPHTQPEYRGPVMTPSIGKRKFQAGGSAKKTVQQMADEMLLRGKSKPVKETVDLSRRGFFRLPESKSMPLAKIDDKALEQLEQKYGKQGQAPTITEKKVEVSPDAGKTKSTLKSITETPVSRRTLLQAAGSQALQGVLPNTGVIGEIAKVANPVESVVKQVATPGMMYEGIPGMIAAGLREGMSEEDVVSMILGTYRGVDPSRVAQAVSSIKDPTSVMFEDRIGPGDAMMQLIGTEGPPMANRGALRYMRKIDPNKYGEIRDTARDISRYGFEN